MVSETFVRAWNAPVSVRVPTAKAYLFTIARNYFLHGRRRAWRSTELDEQLKDPSPGPHTTVEQKEELKHVLLVLQAMPDLDRSAVLMRALEDMSYGEIAAALKLTVPGVKTKIHRARLRLAQCRARTEVER